MDYRHIAPNETVAAKRRVGFTLWDIAGGPRTDKAGQQPEISTDFGAYAGAGSIGVLVQVAGGPGNHYYAELAVGSLATSGSIIRPYFSDADAVGEGESVFVSPLWDVAARMVKGTVIATVAPTTGMFEASDIVIASAQFHVDTVAIFDGNVTAALKDLRRSVITYALTSGRGRFTVAAMPVAPAAGDRFTLV